ncbi:hypothetical protein RF55_15233 [Lasius niger]|uniref:Uncharacterized protein n=1 Tax=Lasius niger TaxID=67767 RepID=A0A0J7K623_LASNI|nr:hypothetical protein RF55_15233 [Lasius niger]
MGKLKDEVESLCAFISGAFRKGAIRISNSFPSFIGGCVKKARLEVDSVTVGDPGQSERLSSKKKFWLTLKQTQERAPALSVIRWVRTTCLSGGYCTNSNCTYIICRRCRHFYLQTFLAGWLSRSGFLRDVPSIPSSLPLFCSPMRHVSLVRVHSIPRTLMSGPKITLTEYLNPVIRKSLE